MVPGAPRPLAPLPLLAVSGFPGAALQTREALLVRCRRPGPASRGALGWVCAGLGGHRRGLSDVRPGLGLSGAKAQETAFLVTPERGHATSWHRVCVAPRWPGGRYSSRLCRPAGEMVVFLPCLFLFGGDRAPRRQGAWWRSRLEGRLAQAGSLVLTATAAPALALGTHACCTRPSYQSLELPIHMQQAPRSRGKHPCFMYPAVSTACHRRKRSSLWVTGVADARGKACAGAQSVQGHGGSLVLGRQSRMGFWGHRVWMGRRLSGRRSRH